MGYWGKVGERHFDPQFRRDTNGIIRPLARGSTGIIDGILTFIETMHGSNPLVHGQGAMGTLVRMLNGMLNGMIMKKVFADSISGVVMVTIGGLVGAVIEAQ